MTYIVFVFLSVAASLMGDYAAWCLPQPVRIRVTSIGFCWVQATPRMSLP